MTENNDSLVCDVLPLHPRLEPYESLTSFCTRIGQENKVKSVAGIAELLFPKTAKRNILDLSDLPPLSVSTISIATDQSRERIYESTFYNIAKNFGRATQPQSLSRFLNGAVYSSLRYCPYCVQETHYYSIIWRFTHIIGCVKHACRLIERCPQCDNLLPLLSSPFEIGVCPLCKCNLVEGKSKELSNIERMSTHLNIEDMKVFLSPNNYPNKMCVGNILKIFRIYSQIPVKTMSKLININENNISFFENNRRNKANLSFVEALEYIKILEIPFHKIIEMPFISDNSSETIFIPSKTSLSEIGKDDVNPQLLTNPFISKAIDSRQKSPTKLDYEDILARCLKAEKQLIDSGQKLTVTNVAKQMSVSKNTIYDYPEIRNLIPLKFNNKNANHKYSEETIIQKIEAISEKIIHSNNLITFTLISQQICIQLSTMLYYRKVRNYIDKLKIQQRTIWEDSYLLLAEDLLSTGHHSSTYILENLGLWQKQLKYYPRLQLLIPKVDNKLKNKKSKKYFFQNMDGQQIEIRKGNQ